MSKLTNSYEFTNGYLPDNQTNSISNRASKKNNLNYIYIPSKSPPLYHNLNSVSSNTYSSYDTKLSSNNSKTSNVSSSNESSMLNNSYHSTNDEYMEPQWKQKPVYPSKNYYDPQFTNYMPSDASKRPIKIKNLPNDKSRLNETILRNKISDYKPSFNSPMNKRHSVNIDSYPSTPRSNVTSPPVQDMRSSNDKLLNYEYLNNSNYNQILKNDDHLSGKVKDDSYSMLTGSMNKERKVKNTNNVSADYNFVAGNLDGVQQDSSESVTHTESPLYRKIMSKLSEIPDSMFTKRSVNQTNEAPPPLATHSGNINEKLLKQKKNSKVSSAMPTNAPKSTDEQKYVSLIDVNHHSKPKYSAFNENRLSNNHNKKTKYKSMYFDPKIFNDDDVNHSRKQNLSQDIQIKEKIASQAGDLIYTSLPFYSSSLPKKTSNPTYDINDYLYSEETGKTTTDVKKTEEKKKADHTNWKVVGRNEEKPSGNVKTKESGVIGNKNGINAYIKLIDNCQNKQKNLASLDEFEISGSIKHNSLSKKNSVDSSYQSDMYSPLDKLNVSDAANHLDDLNSSYQSNCSSKHNYSLFPEHNFNSHYTPSDYFKPNMAKKHDLNKSIDVIQRTEPKSKVVLDINPLKDTEEIEKEAIFEQSSSFSESISDIDDHLFDTDVELRRKKQNKRSSKNLNIVLSVPDSKNIAKIISNYPVKTNLGDTKREEAKQKQVKVTDEYNKQQQHVSKERKLSNDIDQEISELTEKMDLKAKDKNRLNDSIDCKYPVLMRKISTPPPLPNILDNKNKRNTIHGSDNIYMSMNKQFSSETKPASITSAIRDGKTEKPIRVGHGLLPPPPPLWANNNSITSNLDESLTKETKSKDDPSKLNESVYTNKTESVKSNNKRPQLIKNNHVVAKIAQKDPGPKGSRKDDKLTTTTNLPQLDKIDYVLKTNDDKLLTNIIPYVDDKKNQKNKYRKAGKNFYLNEYKLDDDTWSSNANGKNFYENYARENDRRKKEGSGFLMLLPGIAIPIETDAADSDESG